MSHPVWLLLPADEEETTLPLLLQDVRATLDAWEGHPPFRVVVVDDGSEDGTAEAARQAEGLDLTLLVHEANRGLGEAMRTGILYVLEHAGQDDFLVTMDADHSHPPELIPGMVARAEQGADLVIASRFQPGASVHGLDLLRQGISLGASWVLRILFPGARAYTCGYRLYDVGLLRWGQEHSGKACHNQEGFSVMVDLLLKLRRRARRIEEVPLTLRYDRKTSTSKMRLMKTARTTLGLLGRRFVGNPHGPLEPPARDAVVVFEYGAVAMGS
jgi:dolichol-phosphate mannosyltransferase